MNTTTKLMSLLLAMSLMGGIVAQVQDVTSLKSISFF